MKNIKIFAAVVGAIALEGCCLFPPRYTVDMESEPVSLYRYVGADNVKVAIEKAAGINHWSVIKEEQNKTELLLEVRGKHTLIVSVSYTDDSFVVNYLDSNNLNYNPNNGGIHRKYPLWVRRLKQSIRQEALMKP